MRFDPEIDSRLVVIVGLCAPMYRVAINQEGITTLLGKGAKLSLGENRMGCVQKDMLELSGPGLIPIVEDFDAPDLAVFQGPTNGFMDFPMRYLTFPGLAEQNNVAATNMQRWNQTYTICSCSSVTPGTFL